MVNSGFIHTTPGEGLLATTSDFTHTGLDVTIRNAQGFVQMSWKKQRRSNGISPRILRESFKFNLENNPGDRGDSVSLALDEAP